MKVSNFEITPRYAAQGEHIKIRFTLEAERGDNIDYLRVWADFENHGGEIWYKDSGFSLAITKSIDLELDAVIPYSPGLTTKLEMVRSIQPQKFGIQLGDFTREDVLYTFDLIDRKYMPSVNEFKATRHTNGFADDEGEQIKIELSIGAATRPKSNIMNLLLWQQKDDGVSKASYIDFTNNSETWFGKGIITLDLTDHLNMKFDKNSDWIFTLQYQDQFEVASKTRDVPMAFANLHLSGHPQGGVTFGGFHKELYVGEGEEKKYVPTLDSHYLIRPYAGIAGVTNNAEGETQTGYTWLDGEPIYRFIATGTTDAAGAQPEVATLPEIPAAMLSLRGMLHVENNGWWPIPYAYYGGAGWNSALFYKEGTNSISLSIGGSYPDGEKDFIIIAEYTKNKESE